MESDHVLDPQERKDFFISYTGVDQQWAEWIAFQLEAAGYTLFIQTWDFRPGSNFVAEMDKASQYAERTLIVLSSAYLESDYAFAEWATALRKDPKGKDGRVLPVRIQECEVDGLLGSIVYIDLVGLDKQHARDQLLAGVQRGRAKPTHVPFPDAPLPNLPTKDQTNPEDLKYQQSMQESVIANHPYTIPQPHRRIDKYIFKNNKKLYNRLLIFLVILLILPFFYLISQQPAKKSILQDSGEVQDPNLSVELIDMVSPSYVIPNDPNSYTVSNAPPTSIGAVLLPKNTASYYTIIIAVQNLRIGGVDILIDDIALKLQSIPVTPRPLRIWTPGISTTYKTYPYPVTYQGLPLDQLPDQLLYAAPPQNVILKPATKNHAGENNQLSVQVMSTVTAYLRFQIQVSYQVADAAKMYTLTLPQIFQVVFSDASNWQPYTLQNGLFVKKA